MEGDNGKKATTKSRKQQNQINKINFFTVLYESVLNVLWRAFKLHSKI